MSNKKTGNNYSDEALWAEISETPSTLKLTRKKTKEISSLIEGCIDLASLKQFLAVSDEQIRCSALHAIGKLDSPDVYSLLEKALDDPSPTFRVSDHRVTLEQSNPPRVSVL